MRPSPADNLCMYNCTCAHIITGSTLYSRRMLMNSCVDSTQKSRLDRDVVTSAAAPLRSSPSSSPDFVIFFLPLASDFVVLRVVVLAAYADVVAVVADEAAVVDHVLVRVSVTTDVIEFCFFAASGCVLAKMSSADVTSLVTLTSSSSS